MYIHSNIRKHIRQFILDEHIVQVSIQVSKFIHTKTRHHVTKIKTI